MLRLTALWRAWLPRGRELHGDTWSRRHGVLVTLLVAHIVALPVFGLARGYAPRRVLAETLLLVIPALFAVRSSLSVKTRSIACSFGLVLSSAILVHLSGGATEAHFHFFVMLPLIGMYQQWRPFLIAIAFVFGHHVLISTLDPNLIYSEEAIAGGPLLRALVHTGFVLAESAAVMLGWRHSEQDNAQAREVLEGLSRYGDVLLQSAGEGIVAIDAAGTCTFVNPTAAATLGYDADALVGGSLHHMIHSRHEDGSAYPERLTPAYDVVATGVARRIDKDFFWRADGTRLPVRYTCSPILDGARVNGATIVFHDLSEEYAQEQQLRDGAAELSRAIAHDELILHFQPKVDLFTGETYAVEALVRWQHPSRGLVFPDEFIPLAEATGIIGDLTLWVTEACIAQIAQWRADGVPLVVALNLAPQSLTDSSLFDSIVASLARHGVPAHALELELTETAVMRDPSAAIAAMTRYAELGVGMAIDDFGTGFSSLTHLRLMPARTIKVDRSFVMTMTTDERNEIIVRSTIELAHDLGKRVVAEGVESDEILQALLRLGCDQGQGYHWSRALPAAQLVAWLSAQSPVAADPSVVATAAVLASGRVRPEVTSATRALVWAGNESEVLDAVYTLVRALGGGVHARVAGCADQLPHDLSLGGAEQLAAVAPGGSLARTRLEHVLPDFLATAAHALERVAAQPRARSLKAG